MSSTYQFESWRISAEGMVIGRVAGQSDLVLANRTVSRRHARIILGGYEVYIEDLESTNGIAIDGKRLKSSSALRAGMKVKIGDLLLKVSRTD